MKAKNIIQFLAYSLASVLVSCSDSWPYSEEAYRDTYISVYPLSISLDEDELSGEFSVYSTDSWYIYDYPSWVNLSTRRGYSYYGDGYAVSFTVDENEGSSSRYGYIRIRTDEGFTKEEEVKISQPPTTQFEASMSTTKYKADGDWWDLTVKAASSKSWTISKSDSWVHLGTSSNTSYSYSGKGNKSVSIYVDANTSSYSRSSTLTVKCGTKSQSITITQDGKSNTAPFAITKVEIGNTDYYWNFINSYGSIIYSYQTKYLTPRIYVSVYTPGTYTIYTKLYNPNGKIVTGTSSPTGYSQKEDITLKSTTPYVDLNGWGSNTSGHYPAGQYRWEFWYNGVKIGEKSFTIY